MTTATVSAIDQDLQRLEDCINSCGYGFLKEEWLRLYWTDEGATIPWNNDQIVHSVSSNPDEPFDGYEEDPTDEQKVRLTHLQDQYQKFLTEQTTTTTNN